MDLGFTHVFQTIPILSIDSNIIVIFLLEKNWDIIFKVKGILKGIHPQYSWIVVQRDIAVT